jgi:hypothetical protein
MSFESSGTSTIVTAIELVSVRTRLVQVLTHRSSSGSSSSKQAAAAASKQQQPQQAAAASKQQQGYLQNGQLLHLSKITFRIMPIATTR